jgi:hypothetical protein
VTTTDQILSSLNRQAQPVRSLGADQENVTEETVQIVDSAQPTEYSARGGRGRWLFVGGLLGVVVVLWSLGLFPRILYVETVGSISNLVSMVPSIDIIIIIVIWMVALIIGLLGRRARYVSKTRPGS